MSRAGTRRAARWPEDLAATAIASPEQARDAAGERLSRLVRQARSAGLLGRIGATMLAGGGLVPAAATAAARGHIEAALRVTRAQQAEIRRELGFIGRALAGLGAPIVVLKGAAYVAAGLPAAAGRVFSDVDIMVPRQVIADAESRLMQAGWMTTHHDAYDQRYYRQWMHELPPMAHVHRHTVLDVHHTIVPQTARLRPDATKLFAAIVALPGLDGMYVLGPPDMVLHGVTHLFCNDDMSHALRDLSDFDLLLRHFSSPDEGFWSRLAARAHELGLARPLYYGLRYAGRLLGTPIPAAAYAAVAGAAPPAALRALMDAIWLRALRSPDPEAAPAGRSLALAALYLRGHWLRMPAGLLLHHLTIKALARRRHSADAARQP